jgi:hypothetical protein
MARPVGSVNKEVKEVALEISDDKVYARVVHLAVGVDLLGSKTSLVANRGNKLEVTKLGIIATSGKNGRKILIPYPNVKACELE